MVEITDPSHKDYRAVPEVPRPPTDPMTCQILFDSKNKPDVQKLRSHLLKQGIIEKHCVTKILSDLTAVLAKEPNCVKVGNPTVVIGDIHGQYFDMIHMFEKVIDRRFPNCNLLFLGDYVDRGFCSVEVFVFLACLKLAYPNQVTLLRGNHESRGMTEHFSFRMEVIDKLQCTDMYDRFMDCFDHLPIAAEIHGGKSGNYLCMHGGISPYMRSKSDIDAIKRFEEPPM